MSYLSKTFDGRLELLETHLGRIHVKVKDIFEKSELVYTGCSTGIEKRGESSLKFDGGQHMGEGGWVGGGLKTVFLKPR